MEKRKEVPSAVNMIQKLTQQYAVDQWAKIEASRLEWVGRSQKSIRAEKKQGLIDAASSDVPVDVGMKIIMPATFYRSPLFYSGAFQDAMAIVRKEPKCQRLKRGLRTPENSYECRTDCIGRITTISLTPHQAELYYLRLLLHHKPGATVFDDLETINGIICNPFKTLAIIELGCLLMKLRRVQQCKRHRPSDLVHNNDSPSQLSSSTAVQLIPSHPGTSIKWNCAATSW
ncbi:DNA helicase pif1, ATP-dependent [Plakobranchus ocellatus]|uniref:DNA helicase pif1, ATP-dependent n=1 Tax=Plakobranchus ocellatus TaxID=259542 RepID=A0AAV4A2E4_9GAST|nr:DNA helicase pif1, ATP-dependent [Plakobranchus ocellatus]